MKRYAFALTAWLLLAASVSAQFNMIGDPIIGGGGDLIAKLSPSQQLESSSGVFTDAAIGFNASDVSRLAMGTAWNPGTKDFAISFWVYLDTSTATQTVLCTGSTANGQEGLCVQINSDGNVVFSLNDSVEAARLTATFTTGIADTTWTHITIYADRSGNAVCYKNGVANAVTLAISTHNDSLGATGGNVGADLTPANYLNGRLDSLLLFELADMSSVIAAMATALYASGEGVLATDLSAAQIAAWGGKYGYDLGEASGVRSSAVGCTANDLTPTYSPIIAPPTYGTEKFADPGIESWTGDDPDDWSIYEAGSSTVENDAVIAHGGSSSAKISTIGAASFAEIYQDVSGLSAGQSLRLDCWCRGDGTNSSRYAVTDLTNSAVIKALDATGVTGTNWTKIIYDFTVPAGCTSVRVELFSPLADGGISWFDDISLKQVTAAINAGGFEAWTVPSAAQLVANPYFTSATTNWTGSGATLSSDAGGVSGNMLTITNDGDAAGEARSDAITTTANAVYKLTAYHKNGSSTGKVNIGTAAGGSQLYSGAALDNADWTASTVIFKATSTTTYITLVNVGTATGNTTLWDSVECVTLPSNADTWTESVAGSSLIYREDTAPYSGSHALAMQVDASSSKAAIQLASNLTVGKTYSYSFYAKAASGTPGIRVGTATTYNTETLSTSYAAKTNTFIADATTFEISCVTASATVYVDSLTELATVVLPSAGIVRGLCADDDDVSFWESLIATGDAQIETLAHRPAYDDTTEAWPIITSDGVDDRLTTAMVPGDAGTIVCVLSGGATGDVYVGASHGTEAIAIANTAGVITATAGDGSPALTSDEDPTTGFRIVVFSHAGASGAQFLMVDGTVEDTETQTGTLSITETLYLFAENDDGTAADFAEASIARAYYFPAAISQSSALGITKKIQTALGLSP